MKKAPPDGTAGAITPQDWERSGFRRRWSRQGHYRWSFNGGRWMHCRSRCVGREGPNHSTDLSGLERCGGFLTLYSKRTGTAMTRTSTIDQTDRAIALRSALM